MAADLNLILNGTPVPVYLGENTALALAAKNSAAASAAAALAAAGIGEYADTSAGLAGTTEGDTFWVGNGDGTGTVYRHDAGPVATSLRDFIIDPTGSGAAGLTGSTSGTVQAALDARPTTAALASTDSDKGAALIGVEGGGNVQDHITLVLDPLPRNGTGSEKRLAGVIANFPATPAGGDDAPNVVLGSSSGTDLPAATFGNIIWTPRDNDVSGGDGYRNRLGPAVQYSAIFGGDNDFNALAVFAIGHHHRADTTGGGSPTHPMMIGSFNVVTSAYGVAIGTLNNVHSTKSVVIGSGGTIGVEGDTETSRESAIVGGQGANITGLRSFVGAGLSITAAGSYAAGFGRLSKASHDYTIASGYLGTTSDKGERVHSPGPFNASATTGDNLDSRLNLFRTITGGTATQLCTDGSTAITVPGSNSSHVIVGIVHAVRTDVQGEEAIYRVSALISNMDGTLSVKSSSVDVLYEDDSAWNVDVVVSGSTYQIRFQGQSGETYRVAGRFNRSIIRVV